jgi:hypothetical protein
MLVLLLETISAMAYKIRKKNTLEELKASKYVLPVMRKISIALS